MMRLTGLAATEKFLPEGAEYSSAAARRGEAAHRGNLLKYCEAKDLFFVGLRRTAKRFRFEDLFPMGAVSGSAKNQIAMSLRLERDELGNDFILPVSEEVGVIHETKVLLVGFHFGKA
jgi:hypothetical protein